MVGDDNRLDAVVDGQPRVFARQDAFHHDRQSGRRAHPLHPVPGQVRRVRIDHPGLEADAEFRGPEHARARPFRIPAIAAGAVAGARVRVINGDAQRRRAGIFRSLGELDRLRLRAFAERRRPPVRRLTRLAQLGEDLRLPADQHRLAVARRLRRKPLAVGHHDVLRATGAEQNRMIELLPEQLERGVDFADVDHDFAPHPPVAEGVAIGAQRQLVAGACGDVVVGGDAQALFRGILEFMQVDHAHDLGTVFGRADHVGVAATGAALPSARRARRRLGERRRIHQR